MSAQPHRSSSASDLPEPALHELPPVRIAGQMIAIILSVRWADGAWRGRLRFTPPGGHDRETAEIFCGATQEELWRAVGGIGNHHLRALYQSLS